MASLTSTCLVEIDGKQLPADIVPLLVAAYVDDSQQLPDTFVLRFRDPNRMVISKAAIKIGSLAKVSVQVAEGPQPDVLINGEVTALEAEYDQSGTFTVVRGYDQTHRFFRGRKTASYQQMTASDIATKIAQRASLQIGEVTSTTTVFDHYSQAGQTDWEVLSALARANNLEVAVRDGKFSFAAPAVASKAPAPSGSANTDPLVLALGKDLLRFRSILTSAQQVGQVEVRGWDVATKTALTATEEATTTRIELPTVTPQKLARTSATRATWPPTSRTGARPRSTRRPRRWPTNWPVRSRSSRVPRGETRSCGPGQSVSIDGLGEPFDGKYTITTSRHRFDPITGYSTSFSVTGRRDRTMLGLASGGGRGKAPAGIVIGQVSDAADPEKAGPGQADLPVVVGRLRQRLGADGAAGSGQGPRLAGVARGRRRGAGGVRAGELRPAHGGRRPLQRGGHHAPGSGGSGRRRHRADQPPLDGLPAGAPDRSGRRVGQGGRTRRDHRREAEVDHGPHGHHDHPARGRQGEHRRHPGHHDRFLQREHRSQGQPDLAQGDRPASPSTAAAVRST